MLTWTRTVDYLSRASGEIVVDYLELYVQINEILKTLI